MIMTITKSKRAKANRDYRSGPIFFFLLNVYVLSLVGYAVLLPRGCNRAIGVFHNKDGVAGCQAYVIQIN